ncbi:MAG: head-tail adaptor protein [Rickettsiales bacterium]
MRGVRAGRLKDRLTIQQGTESQGEWGGAELTYTDLATRKCELRPLRAAEFYRAGGEQVQAVYEVRFRWEPNIFNEAHRLLDTRVSPNRVFDIDAIINTGNWNSEVVITATERKWPER